MLGASLFNVIRGDACGARAVVSAVASGLASGTMVDTEVRGFLSRSWERLVAVAEKSAPGKSKQEPLLRAASLLGDLLAATPEKEAREGFRTVLAEWSASALQAPGATAAAAADASSSPQRPQTASAGKAPPPVDLEGRLEDLTANLLFSQELSVKDKGARAKELLRLLRTAPAERDGGPMLRFAAEATVIAAEAAPALLPSSTLVLKTRLATMEDAELADAGVWVVLTEAPSPLRLLFLDEVVVRGGRALLASCGLGLKEVLRACADHVLAVAAGSEPEAHAARLLRRLGQAPAAVYGTAVAHLDPAQVSALVRGFGALAAEAAPELLAALLRVTQREPAAASTDDLLATAKELACVPVHDEECWALLAKALVARWASLDSLDLLKALLALPEVFAALPVELRAALDASCEGGDPLELSDLPPEGLAKVVNSWAGVAAVAALPLPQYLRSLLRQVLLQPIGPTVLEARQLATASRLLDCDEDAAAPAELVSCWQQWLEAAIDMSESRGFGRCHEALREARRWRDEAAAAAAEAGGTRGAPLAELILQGVVLERLCEAPGDAPLELLLEIGRLVLPGSASAARLAVKLERQVRRCAKGECGGLSLATALAVANGETLLEVPAGSHLWVAIAKCIAGKLRFPREVEQFVRCQPPASLRAAVCEIVGGWQALELQLQLQ